MAKSAKVETSEGLVVENWPLDRIKPYPRNARTHPPAQITLLAQIILKYGVDQPIVMRAEDGFILKGHGRRLAALEAKMATFPVIVRHGISEADAHAMRIADNQVALLSGWDRDLLRDELTLLSESDYDMTLLAFDPVTLEWLVTGDVVLDPQAEWAGMPGFVQNDIRAFRSIIVHFKDQAAVDQFAERVNQTIGEKTKYLWFPNIEIERQVVCEGAPDESAVPPVHREQGAVGEPADGQGPGKDEGAVPRRRRAARARAVRDGDRPEKSAGAG